MKLRIAALAAILFSATATSARAQGAAEHIAAGNREQAALNITAALQHYREAIQADPTNGEALWRAAGDAVDLGEFAATDAERRSLYKEAEGYARRAVQASPTSAVAHFTLAKALGRYALSLGTRERVRLAGEIRSEALKALQLDPGNAGAMDVMGMWNAEIMRLNGVSRFFAKNVLGGQVFGTANWDDAQKYLEQAVAKEPDRVVHRLNLAGVYADRGMKDKAKAMYEAALKLPNTDYNDRMYKQQIQARLRDLD